MKSKANYCIQEKNATSVNVLRSWLNAVGIPNRPGTKPGVDLEVDSADGSRSVPVAVVFEPQAMSDGVSVPAKALTGKNQERAFEAFWAVTDRAGYPRVQPIDRGGKVQLNEKGNMRKLHYKDEDFLVAIRHSEFRRSPNPASDRWEQYLPTMKKVVRTFAYLNYDLMTRHGLSEDDLMQYARCYIVNFCARYETPTPVYCDNERKAYKYLQQRFNGDLRPILFKKERSMMPDGDTVRIALFDTAVGHLDISPSPINAYVTALDNQDAVRRARQAVATRKELPELPEEMNEEPVDFDYVARNCQLDTSSPRARQQSASTTLTKLLDSLPHDQMLVVLRDAAADPRQDVSARKEALRRIRRHSAECSVCLQNGSQVDEEPTDSDFAGAEE